MTAASDLPDLRESLQTHFGFSTFRDGQQAIIEKILAGKSALAVFPTGGGKSLCYQLPALHLKNLTIVISPLIALMKDQIDFLKRKHIAAERLDSTLTWAEAKAVYEQMNRGALRLLYIAPERLGNPRFTERLRHTPIDLLVIDEAHCISEWGHNFRPDYLKLARLAERLKVGRVLTLTATATPTVAGDICKAFSIAPDDYVQTSFYRSNLTLRLTPCASGERQAELLTRLRDREPGATIVYVTLRHTAEEIAALITREGFSARAYHAGLKAEEREGVQDWFMRGRDHIVVATIAFGMGIDKADIRYVYHYNLPKSPESYAQEIGRAGRDELESTCEVLAATEDVITIENFVYGDTPTAEAVAAMVRELLQQPDDFDLSIYEWFHRYDVRSLVFTTLLTYLELLGILEARGVVYNEYLFQPAMSSKEMLARFDAPRADFLRQIFRCAARGKTWLKLDVSRAVQRLNEPRERICRAMNYLESEGLLTMKVAGVRSVFRFLKRPDDVDALIETLTKRFHGREAADLARIKQIVEMIEHQGCTTRYLLDYFGETMKRDCGHCGWCLGARRGLLPRANTLPLSATDRDRIQNVVSEHAAVLKHPRHVAGFLCGIHSPARSRAKLPRHPLFGAYETTPFAEVLAFVSAMMSGDTPINLQSPTA